jgi:hypothetical protein
MRNPIDFSYQATERARRTRTPGDLFAGVAVTLAFSDPEAP